MLKQTRDVCVIGGGPAGLAAATWLGRFRKSAVVFDSGLYRNRWTRNVHGYLGADPVDPAALLKKARINLGQYEDITVVTEQVTKVGTAEDGFIATTPGGEFRSRRLILATGVVDSFPQIERFKEHYGADVFHCPLCDGFEQRDKKVAVLGFSEHSAKFAANLLNWAASVTLIVQGNGEGEKEYLKPWRSRGATVVEGPPRRLRGRRGALEGIELDSGEVIGCEAAFFSTGNYPKSALAEQLGCRFTGEDCVEVDKDGLTSVEGVYAAGDLTPGPHLVQVAAAKGAIAGIACAESLMQ